MSNTPSSSERDKAKAAGRQVGTPKGSRALTKQKKGLPQVAWISILVVVVLVVGIIGYALLKPTAKGSGPAPADATVINQVENIPQSVYDTVGVSATPNAAQAGFTVTKNQPVYYGKNSAGAKVPATFYFGAEFCPYCAADRWALIAAFSRFGTFSGLKFGFSSPTDVYPNTPTFTFRDASYASKYVDFQTIENEDVNHNPLQQPSAAQLALIKKYEVAPFGTATPPNYSYPFLTFANAVISNGPAYSPQWLQGSGIDQKSIAAGLSDPNNVITQQIVTAANYFTASICKTTGQMPTSVCSTSGVKAATSALAALPPVG